MVLAALKGCVQLASMEKEGQKRGKGSVSAKEERGLYPCCLPGEDGGGMRTPKNSFLHKNQL